MSSDPFEDRRQRIINHLNRDHQPVLSRYLEHFASLPRHIAWASPDLRQVSFDRLLIHAADGHDYSVPFLPPLSSWDEIRPRIIEMDAAASAALDPAAVTEFTPPEGVGAFVFTGVLFYFFCSATLPWVVPGSAAWDFVSAVFPGGPIWYRWVVKTIFWPTVLLHTAETILFERIRLQRYGVSRGSKVWWMWIANCWIEGVTTFKRIDGLAAAKKGKGTKTK